MSKMWEELKALQRSELERKLRARGYWPGAETNNYRLWWNEEDECVLEEKKEEEMV